MKKSRIIVLFIALGSVLGLTLSAQAADVQGDWDITITTPRGERASTMTIVQDGEKIKVTMSGPRGDATGEGTIQGEDISWSITRTTPRGDMTLTYKGKVTGETMAGDVQMGDFGSSTWKAARKKA